MSTSDWLFIQQALRSSIFMPLSHFELISFLKSNSKPISIAGEQFSSGGHTLVDDGIIISLKRLSNVTDINILEKQYTVESGATWDHVLNTLITQNMVPLAMQSYKSFSIGGSIGVNAHGRMTERVSDSIVWIDIITSNGEIIRCSSGQNSDLFCAVVGGYGVVGIIWRARLKAQSNKMLICRVYPHDETKSLEEEEITNFISEKPILYNCDISNIQQIHHVLWEEIPYKYHFNLPLTQKGGLLSQAFTRFGENIMYLIKPAHDWYQAYLPYQINGTEKLLSYEMGYNAKDLVPLTPFRLFQSLLQDLCLR